ncbi:nuclear pore complex protein Nup188 [Klebsormidium nitens]|uniref:Nuclear pore complex protein Nup188 n=1 Tax=Klebsormidium nitens TaxID=105231 RepID=A0A1Y1INI3_KLENI|nr:nuclear pore complex protein Nup188 [Klebsormidium nitens]|eukprot:GAQ90187.1 nuclear pore complex protein Nup188 [Klebsormidium nitens]
MAQWWRCHQEVQSAIESFGAAAQEENSREEGLKHRENEVGQILREHHQWFLNTFDNFKPPSAASKAALQNETITLGPETIPVTADLRETALEASARLDLDETQAYLMVHRCAEDGDGVRGGGPGESDLLDQVVAYHGAERSALVTSLRTLLSFQDGDGNQGNSAVRVFADAVNRLIKDGLEANLVATVKRHLVATPPASLDSASIPMWADQMAGEQSLLISALFMLYFTRPPTGPSRLLELLEYFSEHVFLQDEFATDTWQAYATSDLALVRHLAVLLLLVLMGLEKLPASSKNGDSPRSLNGYPFDSASSAARFDSLLLSLEDASPYAAPLSLAWASSITLLRALPDSGGSDLLADLPPDGANVHIQRAEEGAVFEQMLGMLRQDEFRVLEPQVTAYKHTMKLLVSTSLRAYNLYSPVVDESNPRGQTVVDLLSSLFFGEEYLALSFFDSPLDAPIKELAEALALFFPARSRRLLQLLTSLCQGPWATENVFNFLYHQRTVAFPHPHAGGAVQALLPTPLPHAPGLYVPRGTQGAVLGSDDVIDDVGRRGQLVAWECRHHPVLVLLLMARQLSKRLARGGGDEVTLQLRPILELLAALTSFGGAPVATLVLELDSSPLVVAGKRDGRVDPGLQLDTIRTLAAICHNVGHGRGVGLALLPAVLTVMASFVEICPARVGVNFAQVGLFEVSGEEERLYRLQEVLEGGEYRTGEAKLTLAVLELVHRLVEHGVQSRWAAAVVRQCVEEILQQVKGRRFLSQLSLWQVVGRSLDVAAASLASYTFANGQSLPLQTVTTSAFLHSANPESRNMLLSVLAVGATGLEAIEFSATSTVGELEAAQDAVAGALRLFTSLLEHSAGEAGVNALEALVFKDGNESVLGALATFLRYTSSESLQAVAADSLRALIMRAAQTGSTGGELATGIVRALRQAEAKRVQVAIGEALESVGVSSRASNGVADLLSAAGVWQPSLVAWAFIPANGRRTEDKGPETEMRTTGEKSKAMQALARLVTELPELAKSAPTVSRRVLAMLLALFQSCGPDAAESGLGLGAQLWAILAQVLGATTEQLRTSSDAETEDVAGNHRVVVSLVLSLMSEQMWAVARNRGRRAVDRAEGKLEGARNGAVEIVSDWEGKVGERPSETAERLCQSVTQDDGLRNAVILCRVAVLGMLTSPPPRADATIGEALERARQAFESHPAFNRLARDPVYSSTDPPDALILTDLAAHLSGALSHRPIPTGPFLELAAYIEELQLESLLMRPSRGSPSSLTSSDETMTSSAEILTSSGFLGPFDVAGAARAVGPEAGEAVREALEAVERWNGAEIGARAQSQLGRAFALAVGMAAVTKGPGDTLWPTSELSTSVSTVCAAFDSSASQSADATSSNPATSFGRVSVLAGLLASLTHASPPQTRSEITPLVVQTAARMIQSQNGRPSPWLGSPASKLVLQTTVKCLTSEGSGPEKSTSLALRGDQNGDKLPGSDDKLPDALPSLCQAVVSPGEQLLVSTVLSQLLSRLPIDSWEGRVMQNLAFAELVRCLPAAPTGQLEAVLGLLKALVQRSGEIAGRLVEAGLVQALTSLGQAHPPPSPHGPFSLTWDQTPLNPDQTWGSVTALLAALPISVPRRYHVEEKLEAAVAALGPSLLQSLTPPIADPSVRPRMSISSVRAALHSAQLLARLHQPGATLAAVLGPRFVSAIDRATSQTLHFVAQEGLCGGNPKKGRAHVGCIVETREERALARTEPDIPAESALRGWFGVVSAWAKEESSKRSMQTQERSMTSQPSSVNVSGISREQGAYAMRAGPSAYTEALADDVYLLGEVLARYTAVRIGEALSGAGRHVSGGSPPPELPTSETLHALQDQCLLVVPVLAPFPSLRGPVLALLDHAYLLEASVNQLFGAHPSKLRAESAAKHVKAALTALRQQGSPASSDTARAVESAARQMYPQAVEQF